MFKSGGSAGERVINYLVLDSSCPYLTISRFLKDLDKELLGELDAVCRDNQMGCFPVARGRNSDDYFFEKYPQLVTLMERDKQRRIDSMKLQSRMDRVDTHDIKPRQTSIEKPPGPQSTPGTKGPAISSSPVLRSRQSISDLMFQMDEEATLLSPGDSFKGKSAIRGPKPGDVAESPALGSSLVEGVSFGERSYLDGQMKLASLQDNSSLLAESPAESRAEQKKNMNLSTPPNTTSSHATPWGSRSPMLPTTKKDLKDIMKEASENPLSTLSLGISRSNEARAATPARRESSSSTAGGGGGSGSAAGNFTPKLSQKERRKLQQQQMQERLAAEQRPREESQNPWKLPPLPPAGAAGPTLADKPEGLGGQESSHKVSAQKPAMTLRQTLAGGSPQLPKPGAAPVQTQTRSVSANVPPTAVAQPNSNPPTPKKYQHQHQQQQQQPTPIQSVRHIPRPGPPSHTSSSSNSLSLAAILMQQQTEKDEIREAATTKHNLQDIQLEQEFQEWWDKESRRVQGLADPEDEEGAAAGHGGGSRDGEGKNSGRGGRRSGHSNNNKRRGGGAGSGPGAGKEKGPSSALTQQLSRQRSDTHNHANPTVNPTHQQAHAGNNHPDSRRGGNGGRGGSGPRRRGKERARV